MIRPPPRLRRAANARTVKRREIDALNRDAEVNAKAHLHRGRIEGALEERARLTALVEDSEDLVVYMQPTPEPRYRVAPPPRDMVPLFGSHERMVLDISDVEAVPYALPLTNGRTIHWWGWRQVS